MNLQKLDELAGVVVLKYYSVQASAVEFDIKPEPVRLDGREIKIMYTYLVGTIGSELRYSLVNCIRVDFRGLESIKTMSELGCSFDRGRVDAQRRTVDWAWNHTDPWEVCRFVRSAAFAFMSPWKGSAAVGGESWAYCAWAAANWLGEMLSRGYANPITWEVMLSAMHNNSRWLNKINGGMRVYQALGIGECCQPLVVMNAYLEAKAGNWNGLPSRHVKRYPNDWHKALQAFPELGDLELVENSYLQYDRHPDEDDPEYDPEYDEPYEGDEPFELSYPDKGEIKLTLPTDTGEMPVIPLSPTVSVVPHGESWASVTINGVLCQVPLDELEDCFDDRPQA